MTPRSERIGLPFMIAGQLSKEDTHNEALQLLDLLVSGKIYPDECASAPDEPSKSLFYRIAPDAEGEFANRDGQLAANTAGGWRFIAPFEGCRLQESLSGINWVFRDGSWLEGIEEVCELHVNGEKVIGGREAAIPDPEGGAVIDDEARQAIAALLSACRRHGLIET